MNENLYNKLHEFEAAAAVLAWETGLQVEPVFRYSVDGKLVSCVLEVQADVVTHKSPPKGYPKDKSQYADPANYKYPIDSKERVLAAWRYINKPKNQQGYSPAQVSAIKGRIKRAAKKYGLKLEEGK